MNYMAELAALLGVELGEKFKIGLAQTGDYLKGTYWLDEQGLKEEEYQGFSHANKLTGIITGGFKIVKLPYRPKFGEPYWTYSTSGNPCLERWADDISDYAFLKLGIVFRTKQEAEQAQQAFFNQIGYQK